MSRTDQRFERLVDKVYSTLDDRIARVALQIGSQRVPGKEEAPDHEKLQQFLQVRDSPEAWQALIQQRGAKQAIKFNEFGERLLTRWQQKAAKELGLDIGKTEPRKTNPSLVQALVSTFQQMDQTQQQGPPPTQEQFAEQAMQQAPQQAPAPPVDPAMGGGMPIQ